MQSLTLLIAIVASLAILTVKPVRALTIYIAAIIWYPYYLTIKLGTLDFSVSRILLLVIFAKIILSSETLVNFRLLAIDKFVLVFAALSLLAGLSRAPAGAMLEYWGGNIFFDAVLPYVIIRLIVTNRNDNIELLKSVMLVSIPFALVSVYQCVTSNNPFGFLEAYNAFTQAPKEYSPLARAGFYRANLTFAVSIMLGLYFAMIVGWCVGLAGYIKQNRSLFHSGIIILGLGVISSMSSGPLLAVVVLVPVLALYKYRRYWKVFICLVIAGIVLVEIASNTPWYEAMSRLTFDSGTAYYRTILVKKALGGGMSGHWLTGYGLADPGWGLLERDYTDITNEYIAVLVRYGLLGLVPFYAVLVCAFRRLHTAFLLTTNDADRRLIWSLMSTMVAILISLTSVALFAQTNNAFYIMLAFCANAPMLVSNKVNPTYGCYYPNKALINHAIYAKSSYHLT